MAEETQQQQSPPAGSGNASPPQPPPPQRPTPRRRASDVAPMQMDATPIAEAVAGAVKSVLEEVFGKEKPGQQGNGEQGKAGQQGNGEQQQTPPKRRGSWFWGR